MGGVELAPYAMEVAASLGRRHWEAPHPYRNAWARDRDRVIHSRAFRRLEAKTQVFTLRHSDHFRNRLTHTLEVAQIARTVAGALGLDADLTEALALVHDIGHPPFGHAGEHALDARMRPHGDRFDHNLHALRIVERFEQRYLEFPGLNLTFEVREGIIKHSRDYTAAEFPELAEYRLEERPPLEAQLIDPVDEIAYNTADLDDGFEARLVDLGELCDSVALFGECYSEIDRRYPGGQRKLKINEAIKRVLDLLATDLIETTRCAVAEARVGDASALRSHPVRLARFSAAMAGQSARLKRFLQERVYSSPAIVEERNRSIAALEALFTFYMGHSGRMPGPYEEQAASESRHRVVCDYIAGMTDQYLLRQQMEVGGPGGLAGQFRQPLR